MAREFEADFEAELTGLSGGLMVRGSLIEAVSGEKGTAWGYLRKGGQVADRAVKIAKTGTPPELSRFAHNVYYGKYEVVLGIGVFREFREILLPRLNPPSPPRGRTTSMSDCKWPNQPISEARVLKRYLRPK